MKKVTFLALSLALFAGATSSAAGPVPSGEPKADLHVQVQLANGSSITGIALEGRLVEVRVRGFFREADDAKDRKAGIRVFYYRNANGFIFLPYRTIKEVKVLGTLTKEQKDALEMAVAATERAAARGRKSSSSGGTPKPELGGLTERERELLTKFDPAKGWSAERYGRIQQARIVHKKKPTKIEDEFCEAFSEWEAAYEKSTSSSKKSGGKDEGGKKRPEVPTPPRN